MSPMVTPWSTLSHVRPTASRTCRRRLQDPLFRGSYSYIALGSSPDDMDTLGEPLDAVLFFAGEATSKQHAATVRMRQIRSLTKLASSRCSWLCCSTCGCCGSAAITTNAGHVRWSGTCRGAQRVCNAFQLPRRCTEPTSRGSEQRSRSQLLQGCAHLRKSWNRTQQSTRYPSLSR